LDREVVSRLARQLETSKPGVTLVEREAAFGQEGIRGIAHGFLIAAPGDGTRPHAVLTKDAMVRRRRGHAIDVDSRSAVVTRFGLFQVTTRELDRPAARWQEPHAA